MATDSARYSLSPGARIHNTSDSYIRRRAITTLVARSLRARAADGMHAIGLC